MAGLKKHVRQRMSVSASELAQMGVCERLVVFEHQYGRRRTAYQHRAIERGLAAHEKLYRDRHLDSVRRSRSHIALCLFGEKMNTSTSRPVLRWPTFPLADGRKLIAIWCQTVRAIRRWFGNAFRMRSGITICLRASDRCIGRQSQIPERSHERR